jgi:SsrA-binding protein
MKVLQENKKAYFDYEVLEEFVAGIVLTGPEIKSVRAGHIQLKGAYVSVMGGQAWIKGMNISHYKYAREEGYEPFRDRKLLLNKKEIEKISAQLNAKGHTIAPLAIGLEGAFAKLRIGIVRGRKKEDKRAVIKDRESKRQIDRAIRTFRR